MWSPTLYLVGTVVLEYSREMESIPYGRTALHTSYIGLNRRMCCCYDPNIYVFIYAISAPIFVMLVVRSGKMYSSILPDRTKKTFFPTHDTIARSVGCLILSMGCDNRCPNRHDVLEWYIRDGVSCFGSDSPHPCVGFGVSCVPELRYVCDSRLTNTIDVYY